MNNTVAQHYHGYLLVAKDRFSMSTKKHMSKLYRITAPHIEYPMERNYCGRYTPSCRELITVVKCKIADLVALQSRARTRSYCQQISQQVQILAQLKKERW